jgi:hypothetical protein
MRAVLLRVLLRFCVAAKVAVRLAVVGPHRLPERRRTAGCVDGGVVQVAERGRARFGTGARRRPLSALLPEPARALAPCAPREVEVDTS